MVGRFLRRVKGVLLAVACGLALAACGDDGAGPDEDRALTPDPPAGAAVSVGKFELSWQHSGFSVTSQMPSSQA